MRERLIQLRRQKSKELGSKLTQTKVAEALEISRSFYAMIESGDRNPPLQLAKQIADFYGVGLEEIFFETNGHETRAPLNPTGTEGGE